MHKVSPLAEFPKAEGVRVEDQVPSGTHTNYSKLFLIPKHLSLVGARGEKPVTIPLSMAGDHLRQIGAGNHQVRSLLGIQE